MTMVQTGDPAGRFGSRSVDIYPHPFFDLSQQYIPRTIKEMYRWTQVLFFTHSEITPAIIKMVAYLLTDLVYETENVRDEETWQRLMEDTLDFRATEFRLGIDFEVYGMAYASIHYPRERFLRCRNCRTEIMLRRDPSWSYRNFEFHSTCTNSQCRYKGAMTPFDIPVKNRDRARIITWYPQHMEVSYNPVTKKSRYVYRTPKWWRMKLMDPNANRVFVEETPLEILEAVRTNKYLEFDNDQLFVFKNESLSMEDEAYGIPPLLHIFKDAWLFQQLRRATEAVAVDHILPMTVISPRMQPGAQNASIHLNYDMGEWQMKMRNIIRRWRRDPNVMQTMPFPIDVTNVRGDAQLLNTDQMQLNVRQQILGGLGLPQEFLYGGTLNWSGSSVSLRTLENIFLNRKGRFDRFLKWTTRKLSAYFNMPPVKVGHRDFRMADDAQQKQIALNLRQTDTISSRTTVEQLGFSWELEKKRRLEERAEFEETMIHQAKVQAQAEVAANLIRMQGEIDAQKKQMAGQSQLQEFAQGVQMAAPGANAAGPTPGQPAVSGGSGQAVPAAIGTNTHPSILRTQAARFYKTTPPEHRQTQLALIGRSNPRLAQAIVEHGNVIAKMDAQMIQANAAAAQAAAAAGPRSATGATKA